MAGCAALEKATAPGISVAVRLAWPMGLAHSGDDRDRDLLGSR